LTDASRTDAVHPRFDGFDAHYTSAIEPWIVKQEDRRKLFLKLAALAIVVTIVLIAALQLLYWGVIGDAFHIAAILFAVPAVMGGAVCWAIVWLFRFSIKQYLVPKVCQFAGLAFDARPTSFPFNLFDDADFLPNHDRKVWEDGISGTHENVEFSLVEAKLQTRQSTDTGSDSWRTKWRGMFFLLEFPKPFQGRTIVTREKGAMGKLFSGQPADPVHLEDPRFEKLFEAYSTDQVEARYLLTPTFMERVVALAAMVGKDSPEFAFVDNRLGIAVKSSKNRFEGGSILTPMQDRKRVDDLVLELSLIFHIIDALQINVKSHS